MKHINITNADIVKNMSDDAKMELTTKMYYTRTNDGKIHLCKCGDLTPKEYVDKYKNIYNIKNADYNIENILEEKDILTFYEDIDNYKKEYAVGIPNLEILDQIKEKIKDDKIRLVSIFTHEQMAQARYKVENIGDDRNE